MSWTLPTIKRTVCLSVVAFSLAGALFLISGADLNAGGPPLSFRLTVPAPLLDFSKLDVRDINNQPVTSFRARRQLEFIFTQSLHNALLKNLTPLRRHILAVLNRIWRQCSSWLAPLAAPVFQFAVAALNELRMRRLDRVRAPLTQPRISLRSWRAFPAGNPMIYLLSLVLASTTLLL